MKQNYSFPLKMLEHPFPKTSTMLIDFNLLKYILYLFMLHSLYIAIIDIKFNNEILMQHIPTIII